MNYLIASQSFGVLGFTLQLYNEKNEVVKSSQVKNYEELATIVAEYAASGDVKKIYIKTDGRGVPPAYANKFTNFTKNNVEVTIL